MENLLVRKIIGRVEVSRWWGDLGCLEGRDSNKMGWLSAGLSKKLRRGNSISFLKENWTELGPLGVETPIKSSCKSYSNCTGGSS